ncbi:hypothetical protein [Antrihabitans cavernicola]|uniref:Uncharacterized protein n=1 Tax=Antrihabitans cavernicola TaxID=2495913 RepID=A0A5A7S0Z9_9NOCA|nr:hypothetical protein [Spelaeibacter cavernicola]KAA0016351.1 hypothetical protein FOY51_26385 [Spelaeibacter cavernicola]
MRNDTLGYIGYVSVLVGAAAGGLWLIALGHDATIHAIVAGTVSLVLLLGGIGTLLLIHLRRQADPVEPTTTAEEVAAYRSQHPPREIAGCERASTPPPQPRNR